MSAPRFNDDAERRALISGAVALRQLAVLLSESAAESASALGRNADVLEEMADCYTVKA